MRTNIGAFLHASSILGSFQEACLVSDALEVKHGDVSLKNEMSRALKELCRNSELLSDVHARKLVNLIIQHGNQNHAGVSISDGCDVRLVRLADRDKSCQ